MNQDQVVMVIVAFFIGLFFRQIMDRFGILVEGVTTQECEAVRETMEQQASGTNPDGALEGEVVSDSVMEACKLEAAL
jgi:hypothetical protein